MKKIMSIFGTRPEAIKMAPVVNAFKKFPEEFDHKVCVTAQHREMLDQVLDLFDIKPDFDLNTMSSGQSLTEITSKVLFGLEKIFSKNKPDLILVHGDTTTTMAASLAGFYSKIPIAHVEAGLRTGNPLSPWPEEINRSIAGIISNYHFAPTEIAKNNLIKEGKKTDTIIVTGNTVIDSLLTISNKIKNDFKVRNDLEENFSFLDKKKNMILVTTHRRENFDGGIDRICQALKTIAQKYPNIDIVIPVHLNPNVQKPVSRYLDQITNIYLIEPQQYLQFVYLMNRSHLIITDSGGVQEEAPSLGKPVLVLRNETERPEAIEAGTVKIVGTDSKKIINEVDKILNDQIYLEAFKKAKNPYGDGMAAERIVNFLRKYS